MWWMKGKINILFFSFVCRCSFVPSRAKCSYRNTFAQFMHCRNSASNVTLNWKRIEIISPTIRVVYLVLRRTAAKITLVRTRFIVFVWQADKTRFYRIARADVNVLFVSTFVVCLFILTFQDKMRILHSLRSNHRALAKMCALVLKRHNERNTLDNGYDICFVGRQKWRKKKRKSKRFFHFTLSFLNQFSCDVRAHVSFTACCRMIYKRPEDTLSYYSLSLCLD